MLPERKKFAPITARKPISAVVINTAEFTYRYSTCITISPMVLKRSSVHEPDCTRWMDSGLPGTPREVHSTNTMPPSNNDWKTSVPARRTTDRNPKRSTSWLHVRLDYFTVKGTSPLLMWPSEASTFHCQFVGSGLQSGGIALQDVWEQPVWQARVVAEPSDAVSCTRDRLPSMRTLKRKWMGTSGPVTVA